MSKHVLRTSDLANRIGVQPEAIRYYEQRGLLPPPPRAASGYRIYTPEHLERVEFIKKCQALGFSLDEIRELMELKFRGNSPCHHVRDLLVDKIKEVQAQIQRLQFAPRGSLPARRPAAPAASLRPRNGESQKPGSKQVRPSPL
jgi:MerR family Zn(II)-responsive transcriptional regulator of zntA